MLALLVCCAFVGCAGRGTEGPDQSLKPGPRMLVFYSRSAASEKGPWVNELVAVPSGGGTVRTLYREKVPEAFVWSALASADAPVVALMRRGTWEFVNLNGRRTSSALQPDGGHGWVGDRFLALRCGEKRKMPGGYGTRELTVSEMDASGKTATATYRTEPGLRYLTGNGVSLVPGKEPLYILDGVLLSSGPSRDNAVWRLDRGSKTLRFVGQLPDGQPSGPVGGLLEWHLCSPVAIGTTHTVSFYRPSDLKCVRTLTVPAASVVSTYAASPGLAWPVDCDPPCFSAEGDYYFQTRLLRPSPGGSAETAWWLCRIDSATSEVTTLTPAAGGSVQPVSATAVPGMLLCRDAATSKYSSSLYPKRFLLLDLKTRQLRPVITAPLESSNGEFSFVGSFPSGD
jgi:hypothetical protein